jgi:hypothetical protein
MSQNLEQKTKTSSSSTPSRGVAAPFNYEEVVFNKPDEDGFITVPAKGWHKMQKDLRESMRVDRAKEGKVPENRHQPYREMSSSDRHAYQEKRVEHPQRGTRGNKKVSLPQVKSRSSYSHFNRTEGSYYREDKTKPKYLRDWERANVKRGYVSTNPPKPFTTESWGPDEWLKLNNSHTSTPGEPKPSYKFKAVQERDSYHHVVVKHSYPGMRAQLSTAYADLESKGANKQKWRVVPNSSAQLLLHFGYRAFPPKVSKTLVTKAHIYCTQPSYLPPSPPTVSMKDVLCESLVKAKFDRLGTKVLMTVAGPIPDLGSGAIEFARLEKDPRWRKKGQALFAQAACHPTPANLRKITDFFTLRKPMYKLPMPDIVFVRKSVQYQAGSVSRESDTIPMLVGFASYIYSIRTCVDWKQFISITLCYGTSFPEECRTYAQNLVNECLLGVDYQANKTESFVGVIYEMFNNSSDAFLASDIGRQIANIIMGFSALSVVSFLELGGGDEVWAGRVKALKTILSSKQSSTIDTFVARLFTLLQTIFSKIKAVYQTGDLTFLFGGSMTLLEWHTWVFTILNCPEIIADDARPAYTALFETKLRKGLYPSSLTKQLSPDESFEQLKVLLEEANKLTISYVGHDDLLRDLERGCARVRAELRTRELWQINGAYRVQPLGIFMAGPAGVGKSSFINGLHQGLGTLLELSIEPATIHRIQMLNFPVFNSGQWFAVGDDLDMDPNPPADFNHARVAMDYINTTPLNMEAADIESKGKLWANFQVVAWATNHRNANLKGRLIDVAAFWRRFPLAIELTPRTEYCLPGSATLSPALIPPGTLDVWSEISILKYSPTLINTGQPYTSYPYAVALRTSSLSEAIRFVHAEFLNFTSNARKGLSSPVGERCKLCGLSSAAHVVDCVAYQSLPFSTELVLVFAAYSWIFYRVEIMKLCYTLRIQVIRLLLAYRLLQWFMSEYDTIRWRCKVVKSVFQRRLARVLENGKTIALGATVLGSLYMMYRVSREDMHSYQSTLDVEVPVDNLQKRTDNWRRVAIERGRPYMKMARPTWTLEDLYGQISRSTYTFQYNGGECSGVHLKQHVFLLPRHFLSAVAAGAKSVLKLGEKMVVCKMHQVITIPELSHHRVVEIPGRDLVLIWVPELVASSEIFARLPVSSIITNAQKADYGSLIVRGVPMPTSSIISGALVGTQHLMWSYDAETDRGDCGSILVAGFSNNFAPVGFHTVRDNSKNLSYGEDISQSQLSPYIEQFKEKTSVGLLPSVAYESKWVTKGEPVFVDLPYKSSLWACLSGPTPVSCEVVGTVKGFPASSFKTTCSHFHNAAKWKELELEICDESPHYFAPNPKGHVNEDGDWLDPFVINLNAYANVPGSIDLWEQALDDYVGGLHTLVGRDRARPLTPSEAIMGIGGTDIGGIDLNTSVGPPFNRPKKLFMKIDHDIPEIEVKEILLEHLDEILQAAKMGVALSPTCLHILKDEPLTQAKIEALKQRVFNSCPFAFNLALKMYIGPLVVFMRKYAAYFETAMGVNVTSKEFETLFDHIKDFPHFSDSDRSFYDVRGGTLEILYQSAVFARLAEACNYTPEEIEIVRVLCVACCYTTRIIKGDVFLTSHTLPTGAWITLIMNCTRNSLQMRYCFYRLRPTSCTADFRSCVRQWTLGDDNLNSTRVAWFNQPAIQAVMPEFGGILTDARKSIIMPLFSIRSEVTFLKRKFRMSEGMMLAPIELSTLIKMVTIRQTSELSKVDHQCTLYSNVMAEVWMHGEEMFNRFNTIIKEIIDEEKLVSTYLRIFTYQDYVDRYRAANLCIWDPLLNDQPL